MIGLAAAAAAAGHLLLTGVKTLGSQRRLPTPSPSTSLIDWEGPPSAVNTFLVLSESFMNRLNSDTVFLDELASIHRDPNSPWLLVGDFNLTHSPSENNTPGFNSAIIGCLNSTIPNITGSLHKRYILLVPQSLLQPLHALFLFLLWFHLHGCITAIYYIRGHGRKYSWVSFNFQQGWLVGSVMGILSVIILQQIIFSFFLRMEELCWKLKIIIIQNCLKS